MNTISTASALPRTPADINGLLSVVFVGAGKINPKSLGKMFRVRKKVWNFLLWLRDHNRLYTNRAAHRNRTSTGLRPFFTGTRTIPVGFPPSLCTPRHHTVSVG
jgi:hypothetical protein